MSGIPQLEEILSAESQEQINNLVKHPAIVAVFQKLLEQQLPGVVVPVVEHFLESLLSTWEPTMENMLRKVVKQELEEKLNSAGKWMSGDGPSSSEPRNLALKFLGNVGSKVYTGEAIKGEGGDYISLALLDAAGNVVKSGAEASSEVELMVLPDSGSSGKDSQELRMPHVSPNRLKLNEGIVVLENVQLKRPVAQKTRRCSVWAQNCTIKLVARSHGDTSDAIVERAETGSFPFADRRGTLYNKRFPPQLSDKVWRLKNITRNQELHKLLEKENIKSVEQFLIAYTKDPQSFQQRFNIGAGKLKITVDHAKTCPGIPRSLRVYHPASWGSNVSVVFDVLGCVQGLLYEGQGFVPADNLQEDDKDDARRMIESAFDHWEDVRPYNIDDSTLEGGGLDHMARAGNPSCSSMMPDEMFDRTILELNAMPDGVDHAPRGNIFDNSPEWPDLGSIPETSDSDDLIQYYLSEQHHDELLPTPAHPWIESREGSTFVDSGRSRGRMIVTFLVSVEKFISIGKGTMAPEGEARGPKRQRCG